MLLPSVGLLLSLPIKVQKKAGKLLYIFGDNLSFSLPLHTTKENSVRFLFPLENLKLIFLENIFKASADLLFSYLFHLCCKSKFPFS